MDRCAVNVLGNRFSNSYVGVLQTSGCDAEQAHGHPQVALLCFKKFK